MNAVEIEEAVSALVEQPFDAAEFPYAFLKAFGNKDTTIQRLRKGESNRSDLGGVLQTNNIHIAMPAPGEVTKTLAALKASPATAKAKAKFVLATDGETIEAEDLATGETVACVYADLPNHFGFFLALAGITTVKQIRDSAFDIRATGRLNKLYVELLNLNPEWATAERRPDMNHFMARLIFCFFAEDTGIFHPSHPFTGTVDKLSERDASNTHEIIAEIFRAMNTPTMQGGELDSRHRKAAEIKGWATAFPYVNGGLFSGSLEVPRFSKIARAYLVHIGGLDWTKINPDIFGSMIQAVAEEEERDALGMHYTSVPNILKVLNPLFLDDLRSALDAAGDNARTLLNLRKRMARIRVFDPACGSGNFLVIAYKEMRAIEAVINARRGEAERPSDIPLTNFRGIELRDFPAEIARLALIIAEYQCDVLYRGQKLALLEFLPLDAQNWIVQGNALQLDWLAICPPAGTGVKHHANDLFHTPLDQAQIDFENEGGETYICGNPPYVWTNDQTPDQKADLKFLFAEHTSSWRALNYITGWFVKLANYDPDGGSRGAFVAINTICQGMHAAVFWPVIYSLKSKIRFAHTPFKWRNLASKNAGVTVAIVGLAPEPLGSASLYSETLEGQTVRRSVDKIGPYLVPNVETLAQKERRSISGLADMVRGNMPYEGGHLLLNKQAKDELAVRDPATLKFVCRISGSAEIIDGKPKYCIWVNDTDAAEAISLPLLAEKFERVRELRSRNADPNVVALAATPYQFREMNCAYRWTIAMPAVSSEGRDYLPADILAAPHTLTNRAYGIYDGEIFNFALLVSSLHILWVGTVCGKLELRYSYSNTLGWNTFPVPALSEKNKADLTRCAENILLAREAHFPATIADLYDPDAMPDDLRAAHEHNDEVLERIYIGRRFRNDTERLEKLFELYNKMTAAPPAVPKAKRKARS